MKIRNELPVRYGAGIERLTGRHLKLCGDCQQKIPCYGLEDGCKRWCQACAKSHPGARSHSKVSRKCAFEGCTTTARWAKPGCVPTRCSKHQLAGVLCYSPYATRNVMWICEAMNLLCMIGFVLPASVSAHDKKLCATPTCKKGRAIGPDGTGAKKKWCFNCYDRVRSQLGLPPNKVRLQQRSRIAKTKRL